MASSLPKQSTKRKHETLTLVQKMEILKRVDSGMSFTDIANHFHIGRSTVYDIHKYRDRIENYVTTAESGIEKRQTMRTGAYPQLEETLFAWFLQERQRHTPITADVLRQKALDFYEKIYKNNNFRASEGWLSKFKARFGIRLLTVTGTKLSSNEAAVPPFIEAFTNNIEVLNLTADQVYNAVASGLFWRLLQTKTYVHVGETSAPGRKVSKERITVMPCSNATGSHKLKLLVIGKSKNPRSFKNVNLPVVYKSQNKAWITKELFYDWFHHDFVPDVKRFLKSRNLPQKALLVLDNAPGHGPNDELSSNDGSIKTIFLPTNCTPLIQPMDQNVIQMIKNNYKKKILLNAISREANISETLKQLNIKDAVLTVSDAWDEVGKQAIKSSWKKMWPSITEDDETWEEELIPLQELIRLATIPNAGLTREDLEGWFEENPEMYETHLTDDELLNDTVQTDSSSDEEVVFHAVTTVKSEDALNSVDICIKWAQENVKSCDMVANLRKMRDEVIKKIYFGKKQAK